VVCVADKVDEVSLDDIGPKIRNHKEFLPGGTNANFIEVLNKHNLKIRTYERGVEARNLSLRYGLSSLSCHSSYVK